MFFTERLMQAKPLPGPRPCPLLLGSRFSHSPRSSPFAHPPSPLLPPPLPIPQTPSPASSLSSEPPACSCGITGLLEAETPSPAAQHPAPDPGATSFSWSWGVGAGVQAQSCQTTNTHIWKKFPSQPDFPLSYFCLFGNSGWLASGGSAEVKGGEWARASLPNPREPPSSLPNSLSQTMSILMLL